MPEDFIQRFCGQGKDYGTGHEGSVCKALDQFKIELPSWGFANTGTRFGKFMQPAAATNLAEKFSDAGMVNQLTGACPTIALHVLWDLPNGLKDVSQVKELSSNAAWPQDPSIPTSFRTRNTNTAQWAIPIRRFASRPSIICCDCVAIAGQTQFTRRGALVS